MLRMGKTLCSSENCTKTDIIINNMLERKEKLFGGISKYKLPYQFHFLSLCCSIFKRTPCAEVKLSPT